MDSKSFLTNKQRDDYKRLHKRCKNKRHADRIKAILMLDAGYGFLETAKLLLLDDSTVRNWHDRFKKEGIGFYNHDKYIPRQSCLNESQCAQLRTELKTRLYSTAAEVSEYVLKNFGIAYTCGGIRALLKRNGFVYVKPEAVPSKSNPDEQREFVKFYEKTKAEKAPEDRFWFMDGVHPMHNAQPAHGWFIKGSVPVLPTNAGRQRINVNGAYDPEDKKLIYRQDEKINSQSTIDLIEQIKARQKSGRIILISDNARYNKSVMLREYLEKEERVEIIYLPPYSPNLNLIERLWGFAKKNVTHNKFYKKFAVFEQTFLDFFDNLHLKKADLETLMTEKFHISEPRDCVQNNGKILPDLS